MPKKHKKFADDGWAIWVDGDDTSTVYINDWLNPKGKSYIDLAVRIRGINPANRYTYMFRLLFLLMKLKTYLCFLMTQKFYKRLLAPLVLLIIRKMSIHRKLPITGKRWILYI